MTDVLHSCCRDHLRTINLIMSTKTKEEIQVETMKHLISNKQMFQEFLKGIMCKTDVKSDMTAKSGENIGKSTCSTSIKSQSDSCMDQIQNAMIEVAHENVTSHKAHCNFHCKDVLHRNTSVKDVVENETKAAPRKRKSKYEDVDFSQIYKEPKNSKKKARRKKEIKLSRHTSLRHSEDEQTIERCETITDSSLKRVESNTIQKSEQEKKMPYTYEAVNASSSSSSKDEKAAHVKSMMHSLVHSKCKQDQDDILKNLRSDDRLLQLFWRESSHLRKVKIPIFRTTKEQTEQHVSNTQTCQNSISDANSLLESLSLHIMQEDTNIDKLNSQTVDITNRPDYAIYDLDQFPLIQNSLSLRERKNDQSFISTNQFGTFQVHDLQSCKPLV